MENFGNLGLLRLHLLPFRHYRANIGPVVTRSAGPVPPPMMFALPSTRKRSHVGLHKRLEQGYSQVKLTWDTVQIHLHFQRLQK